MPTFMKRFRRNFPSTFSEWVCSVTIMLIGFLWLIFPASFNRVDMTQFVAVMSPRLWITFTIMLGLLSIVGLTSDSESPKIGGGLRVITGLGRVAMFGAFLGRSFADSEAGVAYSFGIILFAGYIVFDIRNVMRASIDTFNAIRKVSRFVPVGR